MLSKISLQPFKGSFGLLSATPLLASIISPHQVAHLLQRHFSIFLEILKLSPAYFCEPVKQHFLRFLLVREFRTFVMTLALVIRVSNPEKLRLTYRAVCKFICWLPNATTATTPAFLRALILLSWIFEDYHSGYHYFDPFLVRFVDDFFLLERHSLPCFAHIAFPYRLLDS